jgi:hypothetical protein
MLTRLARSPRLGRPRAAHDPLVSADARPVAPGVEVMHILAQ